jgi:hypothetical protein
MGKGAQTMSTLTIYLNGDNRQPKTFAGQTQESVLKKLDEWLEQNKGKSRISPFGADGATVRFLYGDIAVGMISWDEAYMNWTYTNLDDEFINNYTWDEVKALFMVDAQLDGVWKDV